MTEYEFHAVTPERWPDLDRLFGSSSVVEGGEPVNCWCMEWRLPREEWEAGSGEGNRRAMREFIASGQVPGILAYASGEPVGWCSISPRAQHGGLRPLGSYRNFESPDVWLVSCFYIADGARGRGLMAKLLEAGIAYAKAHGAKVIEGYPVDPGTPDKIERSVYWGLASIFREAGFVEVGRWRDGRPVMRHTLEERA